MSLATDALERAVAEVRQEIAETPKQVADTARQHGWTQGQRDMALKMWLDKKTLAEIRAEINRPAEEIVEVLELDKTDRLSSTPIELMRRILRLVAKNYSPALVAMILNADGLTTARGRTWTSSRVNSAVHRARKAGITCE